MTLQQGTDQMGAAVSVLLKALRDLGPFIAALWVGYVYLSEHIGSAATQRQAIEDRVNEVAADVARFGVSETQHEVRDAKMADDFQSETRAIADINSTLKGVVVQLGDMKETLSRVEDKVDGTEPRRPNGN